MTETRGYVVPKTKQPAKAVCQVMTALKNSKNINGPTMSDIVKFISGALHKPATKRQILMALKRTVEFGIIKRKKGRYQISSPDEDISDLAESLNRKGKIMTYRETPKLLDKVTKRASPMVRIRHGKTGKIPRSDYNKVHNMLSPQMLYDPNQNIHY